MTANLQQLMQQKLQSKRPILMAKPLKQLVIQQKTPVCGTGPSYDNHMMMIKWKVLSKHN